MRNQLIKTYLWLRRRRGWALRLLLCWLIGLFALTNDEVTGHDQRFQLRGDQKNNPEIVVIILKPSDLSHIYDLRTHSLMTLSEVTDITDSFFWDQRLWYNLLKTILKHDPKSVGVSLYFGDNIGSVKLSIPEKEIFLSPKVFWSSTINSLDRTLVPIFTNETGSNLGANGLKKDDDGVVRRVLTQTGDLPHLAEKLTGKKISDHPSSLTLNYRGGSKVFTSYSLSDVMNDELPHDALTNKIVIIGAETNSGSQFLTPLGNMNRAVIIAHVVDNISQSRWIKHLDYSLYALLFLAYTGLAVFIILSYPQSVTLIFYLCISLLTAAFSTWAFDTFFIWLPVFSLLFVLATVWFIFVGYQASKISRRNFLLQQEQKNLSELEQLKNNFVSLISHDLKTPIAKIQANVNRLIRDPRTEFIKTDLENLQNYGDELNRYIQSILKLLRVESRDFRLNKEAADLNEIIDEALSQLLPLAQNKNIQLVKTLEPLFSIELDVTLIKEVLINLIENAIKYSPANKSIYISSLESDSGVIVNITDEGYGISAEDLPKIWGKFVRGRDQDLKTKGSGLGLYLVKYFIELHGGEIHLTSEINQGTKVSFTLPFESDK